MFLLWLFVPRILDCECVRWVNARVIERDQRAGNRQFYGHVRDVLFDDGSDEGAFLSITAGETATYLALNRAAVYAVA